MSTDLCTCGASLTVHDYDDEGDIICDGVPVPETTGDIAIRRTTASAGILDGDLAAWSACEIRNYAASDGWRTDGSARVLTRTAAGRAVDEIARVLDGSTSDPVATIIRGASGLRIRLHDGTVDLCYHTHEVREACAQLADGEGSARLWEELGEGAHVGEYGVDADMLGEALPAGLTAFERDQWITRFCAALQEVVSDLAEVVPALGAGNAATGKRGACQIDEDEWRAALAAMAAE